MQKIQASMLLIIVLILGFSNIVYRIIKMNKDQQIAIIYRNKLVEFLQSMNKGKVLHSNLEYLNSNSCEVQSIIGELGIATSVINPMLGLQYNNYQIIINGVDEISRSIRIGLINQAIDAGVMMDSSIGKYIGYVDSNRKELISNMKNPFIWLREGIRVIVGFPIYFLYWTGLIQYSSYSKLKSNIVVRFIGVIVGITGFVSAIIGIITGYGPFMQIIKTKL
ncbi:hypothetical protein GKD08_06070 [Paeniclostridium sordellii]|uniref:hypothetical protein n=1 Tax=Paraclostridium sordellii TaxID=1505 RepID=UPI0012B0BDC1|nr:hypothetical protein [Paeniclostridium sordellii]MDU4414004.1 hypothetical protein [Paeniclostridium sordellii]MRZ28331.1 hypothetical protein [Paeniclostridium sordellii]